MIWDWQKQGNLFCPDNNRSWMVTHAANPWCEWEKDGMLKVYFTCRDIDNRSHIGWVILNPDKQFEVVRIADVPVLAPGDIGLFDDSGVMMGCIILVNGKKHLYYLGWNLGVTVPWRNTIGLAIEDPATGIFHKHSRVPVMDRSEEDPYSISYPCILDDKGLYRMWYGTNLSWGKLQHEMQHIIRYAESIDGINWIRSKEIAVPLQHTGEYALSKPFVIFDENIYRMWYSFRASPWGDTYRIGYAESGDGKKWLRKDAEAGITISEKGWDSNMISYPFVFRYKNRWHMIYNGNDYGKTGFGLATMEEIK